MHWLNLFSGFDKSFDLQDRSHSKDKSLVHWQGISQDLNRALDKLVKKNGNQKILR